MTREEALKVANEMYHWLMTDMEREALETLVPELAGSEDEKTRKELIFFLKEEIPQCSIKEHADKLKKFVSYLEKQKEENHDGKKWIYEDDYHKDMERSFNDGKDEVLENPEKYGLQKEQKPAEWSKDEKVLDYLIEFIYRSDEDIFPERGGVSKLDILTYLEKMKEQKLVECIKFDNEFENQVSHLIASVLNGEHEYNEGFAKYAAQSLLGFAKKEQKSLNISAASEWLKEHVCNYVNSEYNEFHKCVEYDGSIDKERLINDFEKAMRKEQKPNFSEKDSTDFEIEVHEIIAQARNDSRLNDADVLKQFEEEAAFALMLKANKLIEQQKRAITSKFNVGDRIYYKGDSYNRYVIKEVREDYYINGFGQRMDMSYTDSNFELLEHLDDVPLVTPSKPAEWSEEDERMLAVISYKISQHQGNDELSLFTPDEAEFICEMEDKFKSLRPQPKQEWSKEDEAHRKFISESLGDQIRFCKKDAEGAYYAKQISAAKKWLNDLPSKFNTN